MDVENEETGREILCPVCRSPPPKDAEELFARFMKHANEGRVWALREVGDCYEEGRGVGKSLEKAFEYYLKDMRLPAFIQSNLVSGTPSQRVRLGY